MIDIHSVPKITSGIVSRNIDQEAVIVITTKAQVKVVNETGAYIWSMVDGSRSIEEISRSVSQEFNIAEAQAEADALEFISELVEKDILAI